VYKQYRGQATNEERLKELIISLENKLDAIDKILSKQKYLAGDVSHAKISESSRHQ
jgi:glutathione S-transferase